jgi:N-acetylglucosamine malate deacetylase 1
MKLHALAIAAHPDDAELGCGGTLLRIASEGRLTGILDLTHGEMGTRGTAESRAAEAAEAARILNLAVRANAGLPDGGILNLPEQRLKVIQYIRQYQPNLVLCNAPYDRHPDHGNAAILVREACFLSGLRKVETFDGEGNPQEPWRPAHLYNYIQDHWFTPSFVVDITSWHEEKLAAVRAFGTQFYNPALKDQPETYISKPTFLQHIEARARELGHMVGVTFGEGFISDRPLLMNL